MPFVGGENGAQGFSVHVSVIRPGERSHPPNGHEGEEVTFLLDGTAEVTVGDEVRVVAPNTAIYYTPNVPTACATAATPTSGTR